MMWHGLKSLSKSKCVSAHSDSKYGEWNGSENQSLRYAAMYSATLPGNIFVLQTQINTQEAEVKYISHAGGMQDFCCRIAVRFALERRILGEPHDHSRGSRHRHAPWEATTWLELGAECPPMVWSVTFKEHSRMWKPHLGRGHSDELYANSEARNADFKPLPGRMAPCEAPASWQSPMPF